MSASHHPAGTWLDPRSGVTVEHAQLIKNISSKQAVMLGETHDRYDVHRWQLHVLAGIYAHNSNVAVGFEMFPRHCQPVLDMWTAGELGTSDFLDKVDWENVWGFSEDLYLPLFHFCRQFAIPMIALNCRRSLVTEVGKYGWENIPVEERDGMTPSKPATPAYRKYLFDLTGGSRADRKASSAMDPEFDRFVRAQQTWDRAFACNIAAAYQTRSQPVIVGIIGRGHLEYGYGTPFQLADLGITETAVFLPSDGAFDLTAEKVGIGDAIFHLATSYDPTSRADSKKL